MRPKALPARHKISMTVTDSISSKPDALHGRDCNPTPRLCQNKRRLYPRPSRRFSYFPTAFFFPRKILPDFRVCHKQREKNRMGVGATVYFFPHFDPKALTPDGERTEWGADPEVSPKSNGQRLHGPPLETISERASVRRECHDLLVCELHNFRKKTFSLY